MALINEALHEYAELLQSAGFDIYEPSAGWNYFIYSRVVDGRECFGMVAEATVSLEGYSHTMPIAPNKDGGFVDVGARGAGRLRLSDRGRGENGRLALQFESSGRYALELSRRSPPGETYEVVKAAMDLTRAAEKECDGG
jgi:hypothetical protein